MKAENCDYLESEIERPIRPLAGSGTTTYPATMTLKCTGVSWNVRAEA